MLKPVTLIWLLMFPTLVIAQYSPLSAELAKTVPIADVHMHVDFSAGDQPDFYLEQMNRNNVKWAGAVGSYLPNTVQALGDRYIATLGQGEFFTVFRNSGGRGLTNIVCELSSGGPIAKRLSLGYKPSIGNVFSATELKKDWKKLMEEYPNQVMLGSDNCCGLENQYDALIAELRGGVLQNLPPDVMEKVAYKNAIRVFKLKE